jgi:hypothetical protein
MVSALVTYDSKAGLLPKGWNYLDNIANRTMSKTTSMATNINCL